jgi:hypothetical protein
MPTPTYTPLANITLGAAASSIEFGSIPATYRDLVISFVGAGSTTLEGRIRLNGNTGNVYSNQRLSGSGSAVSSLATATINLGYISVVAKATTTSDLQMNINILDYSATDKHTTIISRANNAANGTEAFVNRWANTAAVTSVEIFTSTGNWSIGTTVALYGIVA